MRYIKIPVSTDIVNLMVFDRHPLEIMNKLDRSQYDGVLKI